MLALAIAVALTFTQPAFNSDPNCEQNIVPLSYLCANLIFGTKRGSTQRLLLSLHVATGKEGQRETVWFTLPDGSKIWDIEVTSVDNAGNESCSKHVTYVPPGTVDAPSVDSLPPERWYDVQGRRVVCPLPPGVYYKVVGPKVRRVVIL